MAVAVSISDQAEEWVSDWMMKMAEDNRADLSNMQAKMKLLQKHQVFEAEILAHENIITSVLQVMGRFWDGRENIARGNHARSLVISSLLSLEWRDIGLHSSLSIQGGPADGSRPGGPLGGAKKYCGCPGKGSGR